MTPRVKQTKFSVHHAYPQRPYQVLRNYDDIPTLPTGYGGCFAMAFIPPFGLRLWISVWWSGQDGDLSKVNMHEPARGRLEARGGA